MVQLDPRHDTARLAADQLCRCAEDLQMAVKTLPIADCQLTCCSIDLYIRDLT